MPKEESRQAGENHSAAGITSAHGQKRVPDGALHGSNSEMMKLALSEKALSRLITRSLLLLLFIFPHVIATGRLPDFRVFLSPKTWAAMLPMLCWYVLFQSEFRKRKIESLPYMLAYMVAAMFYSMFILLVLFDPRAQGKLDRFVWYLLFTTSVLAVGIVFHWRAVRESNK